MKTPNIHIYGDSLMKGTVIDERYRYRAMMHKLIERFCAAYPAKIVNQSRFGITVEKGRHILHRDLEEGAQFEYGLIEFGGNDCDFHWDQISQDPGGEHYPRTLLANFESIIAEMVETMRQNGATPILMNLPPIDAEKYLDFISRNGNEKRNILQWLGDTQMIYRFHEMYSAAASHAASRMNTLFIDVRKKFLAMHNFKTLIGLDGIHLNAQGYQLLVSTLKEFMLDILGPSPQLA